MSRSRPRSLPSRDRGSLLRNEVREIIWDVSSVNREERVSYERFCDRLLSPVHGYDPLPLSPSVMEEAYNFFKNLAVSHRRNFREDLDIVALTEAISKLPNLQKIKLTTLYFRSWKRNQSFNHTRDDTFSPTFQKWLAWKTMMSKDLVKRMDSVPSGRALQMLSNTIDEAFDIFQPWATEAHTYEQSWDPELEYHQSMADLDGDPPNRAVRAILAILLHKDAASISSKLDTLDFAPCQGQGHDYRGPGTSTFMANYPEITRAVPALCKLRVLRLGIGGTDVGDGDYAEQLRETIMTGSNELCRFLAQAESLEELELCLPDTPLFEVFVHCNLQMPKILRLREGVVNEQPLISFFQRHCKRLAVLYLTNCKTDDEKWRDILEAMKYHEGFGLEQFHFWDPFEQSTGIRWWESESDEVIRFFRNDGEYPMAKRRTGGGKSHCRWPRPGRYD